MKKLSIIFAILIVAVISCKQNNFGESQGDYGTVVFDLTGGSNLRSIDPRTGLPDLAHSRMEIIVEKNGERAEVKEFKERDEKKYKGTFLVGTRIRFTAVVKAKSGKWKGSSEIAVASGTNNLSVKLNKAIAELEPLKFKLYTDKTVSSHLVQRFSLGFFDEHPFFTKGGKDIEVSSIEYKDKIPSFCRDYKGRTYVFYRGSDQAGAEALIKRYTSEGQEDPSFGYGESGASQKTNLIITSDNKTGNVFISYKDTAITPKSKLFLVKEGKPATFKDITPAEGISEILATSVYNNVISIVEWASGYKIKLYKYNDESTPISKIGEKIIDERLLDIFVKDNKEKPVKGGSFVDSFMNEKNIYLLYKNDDGSGYFTSTGRIIKCEYGEGGSIGEVKCLIGKDEYEADKRIINVKAGDEEFYGPQRFVGFNDDILYVADDGSVREYEAGQTQVLENKNRLVSFNLKSEDIRVKKENLETWMPEEKAIEKTNATLFFSYAEELGSTVAYVKLYDGNDFFKFENSTQVLPVRDPVPDQTLRYIIDSSGNFYVLHKDNTSENKLEKYSPHKTESGVVYEHDYSFEGIDLNGADSTNKITRLYYDHVKKDLYYYIDSSAKLYKLDGDDWRNIDRGNYSLKEIMTIYDGRIWAYNRDDVGFESIGIKDDGKLEISPKVESDILLGEFASKRVLGLSMYNNVLYLLYSNTGTTFRQDVYALAVKKDGTNLLKTNKPLFKLETDIKDIRPIGFDKEKGVKFFIDNVIRDYDGRVEKNINKYFSVKYSDSATSANLVTEYDIPSNDITTWYEEGDVWQGTPVMLWSVKNGIAQYFAVSEDTIPSEKLPDKASIKGDSTYTVYNKFCYDQFGNLYVLIKKDSTYYVVRFKLSKGGNYNFDELQKKIEKNQFDNWNGKFEVSSPSFNLNEFIMAVYADGEDSGVMYYRMFDNPGSIDIQKTSFNDGNFNAGSSVSWMGVSIEDSENKTERQITAIVANKDGVFIAEKDLKYVEDDNGKKYYESYCIDLKKYPHNDPDYNRYKGKATAIPIGTQTEMFNNYDTTKGLKDENAQWDKYIRESVSDMYAYNGVLYALLYKEVGGKEFYSKEEGEPKFTKTIVSGGLCKFENTDKENFTGGIEWITTSERLKANPVAEFAPCHIIGVLPKKIVIASDGYHGYRFDEGPYSGKQQGDNYDNVYFLNTESKLLEGTKPKKTMCRFNLQIKHYSDDELKNNPVSTSVFAWE